MLETSYLIVVFIAVISIYFLFFYKSRSAKLLAEFPSPPHHPILGIIPFFLNIEKTDVLPEVAAWAKKHGPAVHLWSPFGSAIVMFEAAPVEKLLTSQTNLSKGIEYEYIRPWLGDGLLISTGAKWSQRRKMLTPAFHFRILEDFIQVFNKEGQKMVSILEKECCKDGHTFDIFPYITRCALDIICETAMGKTINAQDNRESEYIQAIHDMGKIVQDRGFRPWLRFDFLFKLTAIYQRQKKVLKVLHGFTEKVIAERKREMAEKQYLSKTPKDSKPKEDSENIYFKTKRRLAFLDLLLEVQQEKGEAELSDLDLREETDTFMFGGHDTTSANMSFTIYAIGCYPHVQAKVHAELDEIFGDDREREITSEDLTRMKYLECVIKETLRLYPSAPFIQRKLTSDITLADGKTMPEGTVVGISIYQLHRDPKVFPQPGDFKPERFLPENSTSRSHFAYIPFSAGTRNCIGQKFGMMEEKVLLGNLLRNFKVKSMIKPTELKLLAEMILRPENGLPIQISKR